eukprot:2072200-Amphidinium_carterae.1
MKPRSSLGLHCKGRSFDPRWLREEWDWRSHVRLAGSLRMADGVRATCDCKGAVKAANCPINASHIAMETL